MAPTLRLSLLLSLALYPYAFALLSGFDPNNLPYQSDKDHGQTGYNQCGTKAHKDSLCQNLFINSAEDFCLFAPPKPWNIGEAERDVVSYCSKDGYGTRLIPPNTFTTFHYVRTPRYVQITGLGDFTKVNVPPRDEGGEMDPSGPDGAGNPVGGLVFGEKGQFDRWTEFISYNEFCIRVCFNDHSDAYRFCEHIYDLEGCRWNMPGNYDGAGFDECQGEDVPLPMGEYRRSDGSLYKWQRGSAPLPPPGAPGKIKSCKRVPAPGLNYPRSTRRQPSSTRPHLN